MTWSMNPNLIYCAMSVAESVSKSYVYASQVYTISELVQMLDFLN